MIGLSEPAFFIPELHGVDTSPAAAAAVPTEESGKCIFRVNNPDTNVLVSLAVVLPSTVPHASPLPAWPAETDLRFTPGSTKIILLTVQQPTVRLVITDGIDNLRMSLVSKDAFPDAAHTLEFIRDGLLTAAEERGPTAAAIHKRLQEDEDYYSMIIPLVSFSFLRMSFLTFFEAARTHPNFQGQSQRVLQCNHSQVIRGYAFTHGSGPGCAS